MVNTGREKELSLVPKSTLSDRERCHNHAYLTIKGYNEYNNQVSASEKILEEDLEAAEIGNWFTDNLINSCSSEIISHNEHTIASSHYYNEYIVRGTTTEIPKEMSPPWFSG